MSGTHVRSILRRLFARPPGTYRRAKPAAGARLGLTALEARDVPAYLSGGTLVIDGNSRADRVSVGYAANPDYVRVVHNGRAQSFRLADVTSGQVHFLGKGGNDWFNAYGFGGLRVVADGGPGNNTLSGGARGDMLIGGEGNDTLYGQEGDDVVFANGGNDFVLAGDGFDHVHGGAGNDTLRGEAHDDRLYGEPGADVLYGDGGNDVLNGDNWGNAWGGEGNDILFGGVGNDVLAGEGLNDTLSGDAGDDVLYGNDGNDLLYGDNRLDLFDATGNDILYGGAGRDVLLGQGGHDWMAGELEADVLDGGAGNDTMWGDNWENPWGGEADDRLFGGGGDDELHGEGGNDTLAGGNEHDILYGGAGNDSVWGDNWLITSAADGDDVLSGGDDNDNLYGQGGVDRLYGNAGNDGLFAGVGDGAESLYGGPGADRFLLASGDVARDRTSADARISFRDSPEIRDKKFNGQGDRRFSFQAGAWENAQIEQVDTALANLHHHVGNTRLLKSAGGGEMTFLAVGAQIIPADDNGVRIGGWNGSGTIALVDPGAKAAMQLNRTVYHEFGHNWDETSETRRVTDFRRVSGWVEKDSTPEGYTASRGIGDRWQYLTAKAGTFAREYGKTNPLEDMATTWEAYFVNAYHGGASGLAQEDLTADADKLAVLDNLFDDLWRAG